MAQSGLLERRISPGLNVNNPPLDLFCQEPSESNTTSTDLFSEEADERKREQALVVSEVGRQENERKEQQVNFRSTPYFWKQVLEVFCCVEVVLFLSSANWRVHCLCGCLWFGLKVWLSTLFRKYQKCKTIESCKSKEISSLKVC